MILLSYLLARLREPSTYAGLAAVLAAAGLHFSQAQLDAVTALLTAVAGGIAVFAPETARRGGLSALLPLAALVGLTGVLGACSTAQLQQAASVSGDIVATVDAGCAMAQPIAAAAQPLAAANATVSGYLAQVSSVCDTVTGQALPSVASDGNTSLASWLGAATAALQAAALAVSPAA